MASNSETGHANNVANFESLITSATAFGTSYNPSKESIKLPALQTLLSASKDSLNTVNVTLSAYSTAVATRAGAFEPFDKLITRVHNALKASDSSDRVDQAAQPVFRKLQGKRAGDKITDDEKKLLETEGKEVNQISVAQLSFDSRLENFDRLITLLDSVPAYKPNEQELKVESLKTLRDDLTARNNDVVAAGVQLSNARIARNELLYKPLTGLIDTAFDCKVYIKSVFGATSPQYKQVSKLSFVGKKD